MDNQTNQYDNGGYDNGNRGNVPGGGGQNNGGGGNGSPRRPSILMLLLAGLSTLLVIFMLWNMLFGGSGNTREVSYTQFLKYVNEDRVEAIDVQSNGQIRFTLKEGDKSGAVTPNPYAALYGGNIQVTYSTIMMEDFDTLTARMIEHGIDASRTLNDNSGRIMDVVLYVVLPVALMWILLGVVFKKMGGSGGPMGVGKSNAKVYVQKETG